MEVIRNVEKRVVCTSHRLTDLISAAREDVDAGEAHGEDVGDEECGEEGSVYLAMTD